MAEMAEGRTMIHSTVRKVGNSLVVTIPRESADEYHIEEGQRIAFTPIPVESRYVIREQFQQSLTRLLNDPEQQKALDYLAK